MVQNNDQSFTFDLNKTVQFRPDYAILDMRKISLDPDILITRRQDYIHINGLILLQGEYKKAELNERETMELEEDNSLEVVKNMTDLPDGFVKFNHNFPVDITVPDYRVTNLRNVSVIIQSFDYELLQPNALNIVSEIEINGIRTEEVKEEETLMREESLYQNEDDSVGELENKNDLLERLEDEREPETPKEKESTAFITDKITESNDKKVVDDHIINENNEDKAEENVPEQVVEETRIHIEPEHDHMQEESTEKVADELVENERQQAKEVKEEVVKASEKIEQLESDINEMLETKLENERATEVEGETSAQVHTDEENSTPIIEQTEDDDAREIDVQLKEAEQEEEEVVQDVHFLTTIFDQASNESYSQLRIYIVQDGDTVHTIAKRYDVSSLKLLQLNDLSGEELMTGTLLYIPEVSETKVEK